MAIPVEAATPCFAAWGERHVTIHTLIGRTRKVTTLSRMLREDDGQDMVEYALLASFISVVAIVAIRAIGPLVRTIYENVQAALT